VCDAKGWDGSRYSDKLDPRVRVRVRVSGSRYCDKLDPRFERSQSGPGSHRVNIDDILQGSVLRRWGSTMPGAQFFWDAWGDVFQLADKDAWIKEVPTGAAARLGGGRKRETYPRINRSSVCDLDLENLLIHSLV